MEPKITPDEQAKKNKERQLLRKEYRDLAESTKDSRVELISPGDGGLNEQLKKANKLFQKVESVREAVLDAECVSLITKYTKEQADGVNASFSKYDPVDFITKLGNSLRGKSVLEPRSDINDRLKIDETVWVNLGHTLAFPRRTPNCQFACGLHNPQKEKRVIQRKRQEAQKKQAVIPSNELGKTNHCNNRTAEQVKQMKKELDDFGDDVNFFDYMLDPDDYSRTVEQMFLFSFLIKDGHYGLSLNPNKVPVANRRNRPSKDEIARGKVERKQGIVAFNQEMFQKMVSASQTSQTGSTRKRRREMARAESQEVGEGSQPGFSQSQSQSSTSSARRKLR
eukprot:GCRY01004132.1.p1 GENE.GCRY01004132.1~~GCRY01004132.1.p1  ORF type:complete len:338 (+),score=35.17 GCRY01004132.1:186-1199(+)